MSGIVDNLKRHHLAMFSLRAWRVSTAMLIAVGSLASLSQPGWTLSEEEKYTLCSRYPYNTQCEGYDAPIALSQREGQIGLCALNAEGVSLADVCKVALSETELTVYVEVGEQVALMDNQRRTQVYVIATDIIGSLTYREDESINSDRLVRNTFLFGVLGAAFTQPDKVAQVEIEFAESDRAVTEPVGLVTQAVSSTEGIEEPVPESASAEPEDADTRISSNLVFETGRSPGAELRNTLESLTGLRARMGI